MKKQGELTHKEAVKIALEELGGRARLKDIYLRTIPYVNYKPESDIKATLRRLLQTTPELFRPVEGMKGWWELVSYQEEVAALKQANADLRMQLTAKDEELAEMKRVPKEDDFVKRMVNATKNLFGINRKHADYVRQVLLKLGRDEEQEELLVWIERKEQKQVTKKIIQKISNSQVFNGSITESEFNSRETNNEG